MDIVHSYRIEDQYGATFGKNPLPADFTDASELDLHRYSTAKQFEAAVEGALEASGLKDAINEYQRVQAKLRAVIWDLCAIRARTPAGVALKVRATAAFASFGAEDRLTAGHLLSKAIWEDMGEDE